MIWLNIGLSEGICYGGNEPSDSTKCEIFLDQVRQCKLFKKDSVPCCQLFSQFFNRSVTPWRPHLWSSGQSFWLQIQRSRVRFPALPDFLSSSGSGTGSTQPREVN